MTPTPIKPEAMIQSLEEKMLAAIWKHSDGDGYDIEPASAAHSCALIAVETLRGFIDKYGERIFEAGAEWGYYDGGSKAPDCTEVLSSLKAELGLNDNTSEK